MLEELLYGLDTPGALTRGLLSGRPGQRASGNELLQAYGLNEDALGGTGGFVAEMATDPLNWMTGGAAGAVSPLAKGAAKGFARGAVQMTNPKNAFANAIPFPQAYDLARTPGNPLSKLAEVTESVMPITKTRMDIGEASQKAYFGYPVHEQSRTIDFGDYAHFSPRHKVIRPNLNWDAWGNQGQMDELVQKLSGEGFAPMGVRGRYIIDHEVGHALHEKELELARKLYGFDLGTTNDIWLKQLKAGGESAKDRIIGNLGWNAARSGDELVADTFARMVGGKPVPNFIEEMYKMFHGPDPNKLPPAYWKTFGS